MLSGNKISNLSLKVKAILPQNLWQLAVWACFDLQVRSCLANSVGWESWAEGQRENTAPSGWSTGRKTYLLSGEYQILPAFSFFYMSHIEEGNNLYNLFAKIKLSIIHLLIYQSKIKCDFLSMSLVFYGLRGSTGCLLLTGGTEFVFVCLPQKIGESRNRISSSLRNRLSEQAAERVSCIAVANNSQEKAELAFLLNLNFLLWSWLNKKNCKVVQLSPIFCFHVCVLCECCPPQAAESAEQLSEALLEDLLEDTARAAWAAETDRQLEGMAECRVQAPTLESMLLRMEEIQVRDALQKDPPTEGQRGPRKVTSDRVVIYSGLLWQLWSGVVYRCSV